MGHVMHLIPAVVISGIVLLYTATTKAAQGNLTDLNGTSRTPGRSIACRAAADVIFILDASAKVVDESSYQKVVDLASAVVRSFIIGDADVLFGGVTYSDDAKKLFDIKDFKTHDDLTKALKDSHLLNMSSRPDLGLDFVGYHEMFSIDLGGRYNAAKLVIVLLAGKSERSDLTKEAAKNLANEGVVIIAAGIGSDVEPELVDIASSELNVFKVKSFGHLNQLIKEITSRVCQVSKIKD
ncbi:unnamed protein product [Lymnaea stagnalis]|uniref:VWFA domain-containing protein n=1 Tax=Lymnaea stagnalis TaxID=6523 RepID=A0AAV2HAB6_LYMST